MKIKKNVNELKFGMYVSDLDRPWIESSFIFQGFQILSDNILVDLQKECKFVYIDTEKSAGYGKRKHLVTADNSRNNSR